MAQPSEQNMRFALILPAHETPAADLEAILLDCGESSAGAVAATLRALAAGPAIYVRPTTSRTEDLEAALDATLPFAPAGYVLPDAVGLASVQRLSVIMGVREAECGLPAGRTRILAEAASSPEAIFGLGSYRDAGPRLAGLVFRRAGLASLLADAETGPAALGRDLLLLAAAARGIPALDGDAPAEMDLWRAQAHRARDLGFAGKWSRSRAQLAAAREIFQSVRPSAAHSAEKGRLAQRYFHSP